MFEFIVFYKPIWGQFTQMSETVKASSLQQAEIRFYASKAGDNCYCIINIQRK
jgi:hypothetical protein